MTKKTVYVRTIYSRVKRINRMTKHANKILKNKRGKHG